MSRIVFRAQLALLLTQIWLMQSDSVDSHPRLNPHYELDLLFREQIDLDLAALPKGSNMSELRLLTLNLGCRYQRVADRSANRGQ